MLLGVVGSDGVWTTGIGACLVGVQFLKCTADKHRSQPWEMLANVSIRMYACDLILMGKAVIV
jgi:hypothetical protein